MRTILFVCTGNTCRSPMAEAIARQWLRRETGEDPPELFVASAGVFADDGEPTSPETVEALHRMGIQFAGESKRLTAEMARNADLVLCMTAGHAAAVAQLLGDDEAARARVRRLDPEGDLEDPIGQGQAAYDRLSERLQALVPQRLREVMVS